MKISFEKVFKEFDKRNLILLCNKETYTGVTQRLPFKCKIHLNKIQYTSYSNLTKKRVKFNCRECYYDSLKVDINIIQKKFISIGLIPKFKDSDYKNNRSKLAYICSKHPKFGIQYVTWASVNHKSTQNNNIHCIKCDRNNRSKIKDYKKNPNRQKDRQDRQSLKYKNWTKDIYYLANYKCQCCGCTNSKNNKLNAHHIFSFSKYKELRYEISNGICLCEKCHRKFHDIYGKYDNNKEQLEEFLNSLDKPNAQSLTEMKEEVID